ncbi:MAG: hypothetical protein R2865_13540 [Deinococcales bacterium]
MPDDTLQVLVEGRERAVVEHYYAGPTLKARVRTLPEASMQRLDENLRALLE